MIVVERYLKVIGRQESENTKNKLMIDELIAQSIELGNIITENKKTIDMQNKLIKKLMIINKKITHVSVFTACFLFLIVLF
jgi:hypothetical protein